MLQKGFHNLKTCRIVSPTDGTIRAFPLPQTDEVRKGTSYISRFQTCGKVDRPIQALYDYPPKNEVRHFPALPQTATSRRRERSTPKIRVNPRNPWSNNESLPYGVELVQADRGDAAGTVNNSRRLAPVSRNKTKNQELKTKNR